MKQTIKMSLAIAALCAGVGSVHAADVGIDTIFDTLSNSTNLQASVDKLLASGAKPHDVISVAAASGISLSAVKSLQVCVNSAESNSLSASCLRQKTISSAYAEGLNDPLKYLPASAAGKRKAAEAKKEAQKK